MKAHHWLKYAAVAVVFGFIGYMIGKPAATTTTTTPAATK